jgi:exonuclease VII large subunit
MRQFGQYPYTRQNFYQPPQYQSMNQSPHPLANVQHYQNMYQQSLTPFEQFAKPKQPENWYANYQQQGNDPQSQLQNGMMPPFQGQSGQFNLDKMLSTVNQMANTYHQVSPILKQFGAFMKAFRS